MRWVFKPKHDQAALKEELLRIFGDKVLDDAITRPADPELRRATRRPVPLQDAAPPRLSEGPPQEVRACGAPHDGGPVLRIGVEDDGYVMIDGGIWANNPVMNALVDALACFDIARENLRILSRAARSTFTVDDRARNGGIKDWAFMRSFNAAARAQSHNALGQAYLLVGKNNVTRIDVPESDAPIAMDRATFGQGAADGGTQSRRRCRASHRAGVSRRRGRQIHPLPDSIGCLIGHSPIAQ